MSQPPRQLSLMILAVMAFGCAAVVCFVLLALLGIVTGVLGPCSTAPAWWEMTYLPLLFLAPPLSALWAGIRVYRNLNRPNG